MKKSISRILLILGMSGLVYYLAKIRGNSSTSEQNQDWDLIDKQSRP